MQRDVNSRRGDRGAARKGEKQTTIGWTLLNIFGFFFSFEIYICINFQSFWLQKIVCVLVVQMVFIALNKTIKYIKFEQHF